MIRFLLHDIAAGHRNTPSGLYPGATNWTLFLIFFSAGFGKLFVIIAAYRGEVGGECTSTCMSQTPQLGHVGGRKEDHDICSRYREKINEEPVMAGDDDDRGHRSG
jgi:hypothetical protein